MAWIPLIMFVVVCLVLLSGYPVAFALGGTALLFAAGGMASGVFNPADLTFVPNRLFGIIENTTLMAVPLFVFMGVMLEKSRVAENLLSSMGRLFGPLPGGLGLAIILVGALLAASTGDELLEHPQPDIHAELVSHYTAAANRLERRDLVQQPGFQDVELVSAPAIAYPQAAGEEGGVVVVRFDVDRAGQAGAGKTSGHASRGIGV